MTPSLVHTAISENILERSLQMLERSQANLEGSLANLERSLTIENTLSRLVEAQEELRRMMMDFINGTDIPVATPTRSDRIYHLERDAIYDVKEEEEDEIERTDLPPMTSASPVVERNEEDDISSVSSVSTDEEMYLDDENTIDTESTCGNVPRGEERIRPECSTHEGLPVANEGALLEPQVSGNAMAKDSDVDGEDTGSMSFGDAISSGEETDPEDSDMPGTSGSPNPSASIANSEQLAIWKCLECRKMIRGVWRNRRHHIEFHEKLRLFCPVTKCSAKIACTMLSRHLKAKHNTTRSSLPAGEKAELQRQLNDINQKTMECKLKYFPPSSLVSFADALARNAANPACKKCGKICVELRARRDHVAAHLKMKIPCPIRNCKSFRCMKSMKSIMHHLTSQHRSTLATLTEEERNRFEEARRKFNEETDAFMGDFFSEQTEAQRTEEINPSASQPKEKKRSRGRSSQGRDSLSIAQQQIFWAWEGNVQPPSEVDQGATWPI